MSAESTLYTTLSAAAGVTAIVAARIYPDFIPEDVATPAIAFQRASTEFLNTLHGTTLGSTPTLEITCVDASRVAAIALANAVVQALNGTVFYAIDQQSAVEIEGGLWGAVVSVNFNE